MGSFPVRQHPCHFHRRQDEDRQQGVQDQRSRERVRHPGERCSYALAYGSRQILLLKLEASMSEKGVLQVDKVAEKAGNWVYINGEAVGLSNKLNDFEGLAVRMAKYEASLAKLTASLKGAKKTKKSMVYAAPPEWQGQ